MAELTPQGNIRLTHTNKFRISFHRISHSHNKQKSFSDKKQNNKSFYKNKSHTKNQSFHDENEQNEQVNKKARYPQTQRFKRQLQKIGVLQRDVLKFTYQPQQNEMKQFRTSRLRSLREKYLLKKYEFDNMALNSYKNPQNQFQQNQEIDEAVLGCWKYGEKSSRENVWKQYKQNLNMLNFDVLKIIKKRRQRC